MEDIREIIRATNTRDRDDVERAKERIREIIIAKVDFIRGLAKMCEVDAKVIISAVLESDFAIARKLCDVVIQEAKDIVAKGTELRRDIDEVEHLLEPFKKKE